MWQAVGHAMVPALKAGQLVSPKIKAQPKTLPTKLPELVRPRQPTTTSECDAMIQKLSNSKEAWAALGPKQRATILKTAMWNLVNLSEVRSLKLDRLLERAGVHGEG